MEGWKTWVGVAGLLAGAAASGMGFTEVSNVIYGLAVPVVVVGLGHKLDKVGGILRMVGSGATGLADQLDKQLATQNSATPTAPPKV